MFRECLQIRQKQLAPGHWHIALARSLLGSALARQARFPEAERLLLEGYEALAATKSTPAHDLSQAIDRLIDLYQRWRKPEQAEAWRTKSVFRRH